MPSSIITPSSPLTGSCFCGAVKYTLSAPPVLRAYCHCTQCQRLTGMFPFLNLIMNLSTGSCAQVARLFTLCTSPLPPSRGLMMPQLTPSLTRSSRGRLEPAATCAASRSHHTIRERTELACGARTLLATTLGEYYAGMKYDPLHTYFTKRGY